MYAGIRKSLIPSNRRYIRKVLSIPGLIRYWPLNNKSGLNVLELIASDVGNAVGVEWLNSGIGDGEFCALFDGINDYIDIFSSQFSSVFNGSEGSVSAWIKVPLSVWTDGIRRYIFRAEVNNSNYVRIIKREENNSLQFRYASSTFKVHTETISTDEWIFLTLTWSYSNDRVIVYIDGIPVQTLNLLGIWIGNITTANISLIGFPFLGNISNVCVWDRELLPDEVYFLSKYK